MVLPLTRTASPIAASLAQVITLGTTDAQLVDIWLHGRGAHTQRALSRRRRPLPGFRR